MFGHLSGLDTFRKVSVFIDFHVLALPVSSRAQHDVRLEKSIPTAPISSSVVKNWCRVNPVKSVCWKEVLFSSWQHDYVVPYSGTQDTAMHIYSGFWFALVHDPPWNYIAKGTTLLPLCVDDVVPLFRRCLHVVWRIVPLCVTICYHLFWRCWHVVSWLLPLVFDNVLPLVWRCLQLC
jgi:hypothetical protein